MELIEKKLFKAMTLRQFFESFHLSKGKIHELYMNKSVFVNNKNIGFDIVLEKETIIFIDVYEKTTETFSEKKIDIIYEDDDILVINKDSDDIIHGTKDSYANRVNKYFFDQGINRIIRYPSRLDIETTGVMIFPKHFLIASYLDFLFREHQVEKYYLALVYGHFSKKQGIITSKIGTDRHINGKMVICKKGKDAFTKYEVIKEVGTWSLLNVQIKTGRTHQIRVHLSSINHPILGDNLYGKSNYSRVMLHCKSLLYNYFDEKIIKIEAPIKDDMKTIIDKNN